MSVGFDDIQVSLMCATTILMALSGIGLFLLGAFMMAERSVEEEQERAGIEGRGVKESGKAEERRRALQIVSEFEAYGDEVKGEAQGYDRAASE